MDTCENAVLLQSCNTTKTEGCENDYVTVFNTSSKSEHSHQRWYSFQSLLRFSLFRSLILATAISRKCCWKQCKLQSRKYCGWFWDHCSSTRFEGMAREAMDACLRVLKKQNKSGFDSYSARDTVLIISILLFRIVACTIFPTTFLEIAVYNSALYRAWSLITCEWEPAILGRDHEIEEPYWGPSLRVFG